jgi:hypothetical protein
MTKIKKKSSLIRMGWYDPKNNVYYLFDNKWLETIKKMYPAAKIQLSLLNDSDI